MQQTINIVKDRFEKISVPLKIHTEQSLWGWMCSLLDEKYEIDQPIITNNNTKCVFQLGNLGAYQMNIHNCLKKQSYYALLPKPQTDNYITLQAFPRCLSVSFKSSMHCVCTTGNQQDDNQWEVDWVHGWQQDRCWLQRHRIFSHCAGPSGCKTDSPVFYPVVATALSREGNNLGAASLHCVLLFPLVRGGCICQQEEDNALGWLKLSLCFRGLSVVVTHKKQTEEPARLLRSWYGWW